MNKHIATALFASLVGIFLPMTVAEATYKWIDENGNVVYSQHPPPSGKYEALRVKPGSRRSKPASSDSKPSAGQQWLKDTDSKRTGDKKVKAELDKNKNLRKENCAKARKQLEVYTVYGRIKDKQGNFRPITDDERKAGLTEAKQSIRDFCD